MEAGGTENVDGHVAMFHKTTERLVDLGDGGDDRLVRVLGDLDSVFEVHNGGFDGWGRILEKNGIRVERGLTR